MQTSLMEVIDPTAEREIKTGKIASRSRNLAAKRIGLLDNSKPNADKFLGYVGELLRQRFEETEIIFKRKMSRTEADCIRELAQNCDLVINAFAD